LLVRMGSCCGQRGAEDRETGGHRGLLLAASQKFFKGS
jgi:hypothetical protein